MAEGGGMGKEAGESSFRDGWVEIAGVASHIQTWGGWIDDDLPGDKLIVCITGNPGVTGFYTRFLAHLHLRLGVPVWVINHAGLERDPEGRLIVPALKYAPSLYDLEGQTRHKAEFIDRFAPPSKRLVLIGHSVGAKMLTGVLKQPGVIERTDAAYFLFPTLQHIAKSKFGVFWVKYSKYFVPVVLFLTWMLSCLPLSIRQWAVGKYFRLRREYNPGENCWAAAMQLLDPRALEVALFLADDEMTAITDLDLEVLTTLGDRATAFYGADDGWSPVWQCEDLAQRCPLATAKVLDPLYRHAFVLSTPTQIADMVADDLEAKMAKHGKVSQ